MSMVGLATALIPALSNVLDRAIPDPEQKAKAQLELLRLQRQRRRRPGFPPRARLLRRPKRSPSAGGPAASLHEVAS